MRLSALLLVAFGATTAAAGANLIENSGFDDDTLGWLALVDDTIAHDDDDEAGSPLSGSLEVSGAIGTRIGVSQCVPVVAGKTYAVGASVRIPEGQDVTIHGRVALGRWASSSDCSDPDLDGPRGPSRAVTIDGAWGTTQLRVTAPPGAKSVSIQPIGDAAGQRGQYRLSFDNVFFLEDSTCGPSLTTLCLEDGRFRVTVEWETEQGEQGFGQAVELTDNSGYFWFFNDADVELVTSLLDACPTRFNTFWFFAAGLTNVEAVIRVHDTEADVERVYTNPRETQFEPIQDTDAFDTCQAVGGGVLARGFKNKSVKAVSATFTATSVSGVKTSTCTGRDGTYIETKATYSGTATSSNPALNGPITVEVRSVTAAAAGSDIGYKDGKLSLGGSIGGAALRFTGIYERGGFAGLAVGSAGPHQRVIANISSDFSDSGGFTNGKLGDTVGGSAVVVGPGDCQPVKP